MLRSAAANWKANKQILRLVTQLQPIASKPDNNPRVTSAHHKKSTFIEGNNIHRAFDDIPQKGKSLTKQKYNATLRIARACQLPIRVYIQVLVRHGSIEAETHPTVPQHFRSIRLPIFAFSKPNVNNSGVGRYFSNSFFHFPERSSSVRELTARFSRPFRDFSLFNSFFWPFVSFFAFGTYAIQKPEHIVNDQLVDERKFFRDTHALIG